MMGSNPIADAWCCVETTRGNCRTGFGSALVWFALLCFGFIWLSLVWFALLCFGFIWLSLVWFGLVWSGLVWFWFGLVLVWFGLVWFGLVWFGLVIDVACNIPLHPHFHLSL